MKFQIPPETLATIRHIAILALLGAASVCIIPAYDALSHSTSQMPLPVAEILDFILPLAYASIVKFKDTIDVKLKEEENAKLLANNVSLAKMIDLQSKSSGNYTYQTKNLPYTNTGVGNYFSTFTYTISPTSYMG